MHGQHISAGRGGGSGLTRSVIGVVELHHHGVSVVGDVDGRALVVEELDGGQAGVEGGRRGHYVDGRLAAPLGDGVVLVPQGWAYRGSTAHEDAHIGGMVLTAAVCL